MTIRHISDLSDKCCTHGYNFPLRLINLYQSQFNTGSEKCQSDVVVINLQDIISLRGYMLADV